MDRVVEAVQAVRRRLLRATAALDRAGVTYAVVGANAVAVWVARVDPAATRNTPNVDVLVRRADFDVVGAALEQAGFVRTAASIMEVFLDGPEGRARDGLHVLFAGEHVRPEYTYPAPTISESERDLDFTVLNLSALVRMKLTSFRTVDRVHLRDMMDVGLVDASWRQQQPADLASRLELILDTPDG